MALHEDIKKEIRKTVEFLFPRGGSITGSLQDMFYEIALKSCEAAIEKYHQMQPVDVDYISGFNEGIQIAADRVTQLGTNNLGCVHPDDNRIAQHILLLKRS